MKPIIAALICISGTLSQYAPGVMQRVIHNRQQGRTAKPLPRELPAVDGYIAVLSCADIGQLRTLKYDGRKFTVLVADCAGDRRAVRWMRFGGVVAEIDYDFAKAHGFVGRGVRAEICKEGEE